MLCTITHSLDVIGSSLSQWLFKNKTHKCIYSSIELNSEPRILAKLCYGGQLMEIFIMYTGLVENVRIYRYITTAYYSVGDGKTFFSHVPINGKLL